ncbi:MAG: sigma-70 family RNA polymerase sigma factor [Bacteroidota bacterium]
MTEMLNIPELIQRCIADDRRSQKELWDRYAPMMLSICQRYLKDQATAEDVLVNGMHRMMQKLSMFKHEGSFEGWIKRIIINECLMELRKNRHQHLTVSIDDVHAEPSVIQGDPLEYEELLGLMNELPTGYRTVLNLYVVEGYKHREIAKMLGISINTSKSQLILARKRMQALIKKKYKAAKATA